MKNLLKKDIKGGMKWFEKKFLEGGRGELLRFEKKLYENIRFQKFVRKEVTGVI